jgi:hypothetical protein
MSRHFTNLSRRKDASKEDTSGIEELMNICQRRTAQYRLISIIDSRPQDIPQDLSLSHGQDIHRQRTNRFREK